MRLKSIPIKVEEKHKCPPHWWFIDSQDVGHCRFCPAVCDFGKLQRKLELTVSKRMAAIASETHGKRPRGRKKKVRQEC